jgi:hypothetical protein
MTAECAVADGGSNRRSKAKPMKMLIVALIAVAIAVPAGVVLYFLISLAWIAKGSDEVNGVKDRDAGWNGDPSDLILCEIVCSGCGRHIVGPETDLAGVPTRKVTDLCPACARARALNRGVRHA